MSHFAHYVLREVAEPDYRSPTDPWYAENQPDTQGFFAPTYHAVGGPSGIGGRVERGDTIWLFSQLRTPWGALPPALDAMVVVADKQQVRKGDRLVVRFEADETSCWFPLADAGDLLRDMEILGDRAKSVGQALRFMRAVDRPEPLLRHAAQLAAMPTEFVSYRLVDGTRAAFLLARQLLAAKKAVVWDRWSLPRRLAERREFLREAELDRYIQHLIHHCRTVHGVCTPLYAEPGSYSWQERDLAESLGIFEPHHPGAV